jgi:hypothetical protein
LEGTHPNNLLPNLQLLYFRNISNLTLVIFQIDLSNQVLTGYHIVSPSEISLPWHEDLPNNALKLSHLREDGPTIEPPTNRAFHLVIPASETNPNLCKTLHSAFILNYPSPTLINFGDKYKGDHQKEDSHAAKIRGVFNFLNNKTHVQDDDLVLVVDGYDVFFQLPGVLLARRFYILLEQHNERWRRRYGTIHEDDGGSTTKQTPRFVEKVIFGADKLCFPNRPRDPACAALPSSTLPSDIYGKDTDIDPSGFHNRPRYLNSGNSMGSVADLRAVYARAYRKVEMERRGEFGDQFVFAEIMGEQEYNREISRRSSQSKWLKWLSKTSGTPGFSSIYEDRIPTPGQNYEFGIGLDYESFIFQTMTHSGDDVDWISYNNTAWLNRLQQERDIPRASPMSLPPDIVGLPGPVPSNNSATTETIALPSNLSWHNVPLATNLYSKNVPVLFHCNGEGSKLHLATNWRKMWYQPYARALLRATIQSIDVSTGYLNPSLRWENPRIRNGARTDKGEWKSWLDLCGGFEEEVFGNGKK